MVTDGGYETPESEITDFIALGRASSIPISVFIPFPLPPSLTEAMHKGPDGYCTRSGGTLCLRNLLHFWRSIKEPCSLPWVEM